MFFVSPYHFIKMLSCEINIIKLITMLPVYDKSIDLTPPTNGYVYFIGPSDMVLGYQSMSVL